MLKLKISNDNGNCEQDMYINNVPVAQPNVYAQIHRLPNMDEVNVEHVLANIHDNLVVSVEGQLYYVGNKALRSGSRCRSIEVGVDNNKVTNHIVYVNTLAHIAGEAVAETHRQGGSFDKEIECEVDMATAIPVSYYSKSTGTAFAQRFMAKVHLVNVFVGSIEVSVRINFDYVKVIPEGVTAAHAFLGHPEFFEAYNESHDEKLTLEYIRKARILHVAIGEGTTEFPLTYNGIEFNPDFIEGTNNGNGHAIDRVFIPFKRDVGLLKFTRQDFSNILKDSEHRYHDRAMDFMLPSLEEEAEDILTMTKQIIYKANNEIDVVAVYGGGSILMRSMIEDRLQSFCSEGNKGIKVLYIEADKAVMLEAVGLNDFVHSGLFEKLKEFSKAKTA